MELPAKALHVLVDLKRGLLAQASVVVNVAEETPKRIQKEDEALRAEDRKPQVMRHARVRCRGWQRYCQRGGRW